MASFIIEGGHALSGTITPQGAKNEALEVICATLLTSDNVRISNVPNILDVNNLIRLLKDIGVKVTANAPGDYTFQADELNLDYLDSLEFVKKCSALRGSVLMFGPSAGAVLTLTSLASRSSAPSLSTVRIAASFRYVPNISRVPTCFLTKPV